MTLTPTLPSLAFSEAFFLTQSCPWNSHMHTHIYVLFISLLRCLKVCPGQQLPSKTQGKLVLQQQTLREASGLPHCCFSLVTFYYLLQKIVTEVQLLTVPFKSISNVPHWAGTAGLFLYRKKNIKKI